MRCWSGMRGVGGVVVVLLVLAVSCLAASEAAFQYASPVLPQGDDIIFVETFDDEQCLQRWIPSSKTAFKGKWTFSEGHDDFVFENDRALIVDSKAQKHAISARFSKPIAVRDQSLILQYSVRFQNGLDCGGAYIKLLLSDPKRKAEDFSDETPYVIMFGPDRCGATQKTHFILRHQNPLNQQWEEKHYNPAVPPKADRQTHLYTLELRPDNQVRIYIDGEQVTAGSLLENMVPPISPALEIDDPEDKKPADWIDAKTIPDTTAVKPADWDQPQTIFDDNAIRPEDWDDEVDGEWEPPEIANPDYKGEWKPPQIPNPAYKGEWKPRKIANPHYFVDEKPHNLPEIDGIGFELWTMNDGVAFDNIIVTTNKAKADAFAKSAFSPRFAEEQRRVAAQKKESDTESLRLDNVGKLGETVLAYLSENPVVAASAIISTLGLLTVFTYAVTLCCGGGASPSDDKESDDETQASSDKQDDSDATESKASATEASGLRQRNNAAKSTKQT